MLILRRLIVALITISLLTPAVSIAAPDFLKTSDYFRDQVFKYDGQLGVFVNKTDYPDNICRLIHDYSLRSMLDAAYKKNSGCAGAYYVPPVRFVIPQVVYSSSGGGSTSAAAIRKSSKTKFEICNADLVIVAENVAAKMGSPAAFTTQGLAFDSGGNPTDVYGPDVATCDVLGWIIRESSVRFGVTAVRLNDRQIADRVSRLLNNEVVRETGRTLVAINDEQGREAVIVVLHRVAQVFRNRGDDKVVEKIESGTPATRSELRFLRKLKNDNPAAFASYRESFRHRSNWGDIDPEIIAEFLGVFPDEKA